MVTGRQVDVRMAVRGKTIKRRTGLTLTASCHQQIGPSGLGMRPELHSAISWHDFTSTSKNSSSSRFKLESNLKGKLEKDVNSRVIQVSVQDAVKCISSSLMPSRHQPHAIVVFAFRNMGLLSTSSSFLCSIMM